MNKLTFLDVINEHNKGLGPQALLWEFNKLSSTIIGHDNGNEE